MTTFDKREQGFEAKFAHDEELRFKAMARSNRLLGNWAAAELGLTGDAAARYSAALVTANLENQTIEGILQRVSHDLAGTGISSDQVAQKLHEYLSQAVQQLKSGA